MCCAPIWLCKLEFGPMPNVMAALPNIGGGLCCVGLPAQKTASHRAKFGWPPLSDFAAVTKPRRETRWNLLGCPKLTNGSQPLVGRSSPYCGDMWTTYWCLTSFFSDCRYMPCCEHIVRQPCAMVRRWRFLRNFCILYFQRATYSIVQTCILNSH